MTIRKLKIEELPLLTQLFDYNDVDDMIVQNTEEMQNERVAIFCIFQEEKLLGELHVCYESEDIMVAERDKRAYLFAFRVHKDYQGRGIGTRLLEQVMDELMEKGYREFTVGVEDDNDRARHMYQKQGFIASIARKRESYQGDSYEYDLLLKNVGNLRF